jgi:hypothetical protein
MDRLSSQRVSVPSPVTVSEFPVIRSDAPALRATPRPLLSAATQKDTRESRANHSLTGPLPVRVAVQRTANGERLVQWHWLGHCAQSAGGRNWQTGQGRPPSPTLTGHERRKRREASLVCRVCVLASPSALCASVL